MNKTFSLATLTYKGDFAAFSKLCESIDRHNPNTMHHVIVDRSDIDLFRPFEGPFRRLIDCATELPAFHEFNLPGRRVWWRWPRHLVRGWIYQQLAKIQVAARLPEDAVAFVDSDAIFVQPMEQRHFFDQGRVRLYHRPGSRSGPAHQSETWHRVTCELLGLPVRGYTGADYIQTPVIWSPAVMRAMIGHIEQVAGRKWHDALIRHFRFSECLLYGVFCEHVAGDHQSLVMPSRGSLTHNSWSYDLSDDKAIDAFIEAVEPGHIAVLVQSNLKFPEATTSYIFSGIEQRRAEFRAGR